MVLGSEHYMPTPVSDDSSFTLSDDATDVDTFDVPQPTPQNTSSGLMSLLSGKQSTKKLRKRKTPVQAADTSFDAAEYDRGVEKAAQIAALESKIHQSSKQVSIADYLRQNGTESQVPAPLEASAFLDSSSFSETPMNSDPVSFLGDQNRSEDAFDDAIDPALSLGMKTKRESDVKEIDVKQFVKEIDSKEIDRLPPGRTVTARDLFSAFPKKAPKARQSREVVLKLDPAKLAKIKPTDPFTTKGNGSGRSMLSALMMKKPEKVILEKKVTIKLPSEALAKIEKSRNPLYTKSSGSETGKSAKSVFAMMMQSSQSSNPKLTAIQKLKGLEPPDIPRREMHITPSEPERNLKPSILASTFSHRQHTAPSVGSDLITDSDGNDLNSIMTSSTAHQKPAYTYTRRPCTDLAKEIDLHAPLIHDSAPHKRIFEEFILNKPPKSHLNWPQRFQPHNADELLMDHESRHFIKNWITNAFQILKTQSVKVPRATKIKEQRRQRKREASFIVEDYEEDEETEEEIFVPVLILQGDPGSCKSASIYAAMNAMDGYVHEINTGQQRARKDILSSLKEFCTTQIIHQNHDEKKFQKGVVLFEDCDILFEQDKTFWTVVQDVINFSRRPIVVTVRDIDVVPRQILSLVEEQQSILSPKMLSSAQIKQYLWLCSYSEHCSLSAGVLDQILYDCRTGTGYDLRKALMECQWICYVGSGLAAGEVLDIESLTDEATTKDNSLAALTSKLETLSFADMVETNSHSSASHDVQLNEILDTYIIDDTLHLRQRTLPHELNTGNVLQDLVSTSDASPMAEHNLTFNKLREEVLTFIESRAKKLPRGIQNYFGRVTRGSSDSFTPETQGLPETSVCYSMSRRAFTEDLAPMARRWARFQQTIIQMDSTKAADERTVQEFLDWRKFHSRVDSVLETFFVT